MEPAVSPGTETNGDFLEEHAELLSRNLVRLDTFVVSSAALHDARKCFRSP